METKTHYTIVGIFIVVLTLATIFIGLWLYMELENKPYKIYQVYMNDATGLSIQAPVKYNGVNVGFVSEIQLNLKNPQQVVLTLKIEPQIPITDTTRAVLMEQGITGITYIGLKGGPPGRLLTIEPGGKYPVIQTAPSFMMQLDTILQQMSSHFNEISKSLNELLNEQNQQAIQKILRNFAEITTDIADKKGAIGDIINNVEVISKNTATASNQFPDFIKNLQQAVRNLEKMSKNVSQVAESFNTTLKHSNESIQAFGEQIVPELYDVLDNTNDITENLNELSKQLKQNPAILIRGRAQQPLGPGEKR